jgi:hypothetical protein
MAAPFGSLNDVVPILQMSVRATDSTRGKFFTFFRFLADDHAQRGVIPRGSSQASLQGHANSYC